MVRVLHGVRVHGMGMDSWDDILLVHGVRVHVVGNLILRWGWGWIHGVRVLWRGGSLF